MGIPLLDGFRIQASSFIKDKINFARLKLNNATQAQLLTEEVTDGNSWPPADTRTTGLISRAASEVDNYWSIVQFLHKRLRQFDRRNWRVSYKALILLEHLVTHGPKSITDDEFDGDVDVVKEMRNFQFVNEKAIELGLESEVVRKSDETTGKGSASIPRTRASDGSCPNAGNSRVRWKLRPVTDSKVDAAGLGSSSTSMFGR